MVVKTEDNYRLPPPRAPHYNSSAHTNADLPGPAAERPERGADNSVHTGQAAHRGSRADTRGHRTGRCRWRADHGPPRQSDAGYRTGRKTQDRALPGEGRSRLTEAVRRGIQNRAQDTGQGAAGEGRSRPTEAVRRGIQNRAQEMRPEQRQLSGYPGTQDRELPAEGRSRPTEAVRRGIQNRAQDTGQGAAGGGQITAHRGSSRYRTGRRR